MSDGPFGPGPRAEDKVHYHKAGEPYRVGDDGTKWYKCLNEDESGCDIVGVLNPGALWIIWLDD